MTMRDDVRTAFDREQAGLGDVGDARHRLIHAAMVNRDQPANRGLQWAAAVAAILIAAIVITTFALVKAGSHSTPIPAATPSPRAQTSPTPLGKELNVPDSTPVIVYHDAANFDQVDGITWDGRQSGKITGGSIAIGNPSNNLFGAGDQIVDRHGKVVATGTYGAKYWGATWADDNRHFCLMTPFNTEAPGGTPTTLNVGAPGESLRPVARVGTLYNQTYVSVLACSVLSDRAVVVQSGGQGVGFVQYWVVQLSTGSVLWARTVDSNGVPIGLVASRDGNYVAEIKTATFQSTIFGPSGAAVASLDEAVRLFSWDGSLVVTSLDTNAVRVIRWSDSHIVWSGPTNDSNASYAIGAPEPNGGDVAIAISNPTYGNGSDSTGFTPVDMLVISSSGTVVFELRHIHLNA